MPGSDTDDLPEREIEARMTAGLKRALAPPGKAKSGGKRAGAQPQQPA